MRQGWYISIAAHLVLLLFVLFGGLFARDRIPEVAVADVALISEAEYAALTPAGPAPTVDVETPEIAPPVEDVAPDAPEVEAPPERSEPEAVDVPETPPEEPALTVPEPTPDAVVDDTAPIVPLPPSEIDGASLERDQVAEPAPRVAPVPQVAPPPLAEVAPSVVEDKTPDPEAETEPQPEQETAAAPEAASDRIVTEAEETREFAPASTQRPRARPERPVRVAEPEETPEPATSSAADDAVRAALEQPDEETRPAPSGPPLTRGEMSALSAAVGECWIIDPGARSSGVKVTIVVSLDRNGRIEGDVRQVRAEGGDASAQRAAFEKASRAVRRCGARGFPLPAEKYEQWRDIEMTFNPEGMQFR